MRLGTLLATLAVLGLMVAAPATAAPKHKGKSYVLHGKKCKPTYKRVKRPKKTLCVKRKARPEPAALPLAVTKTTKLGARLSNVTRNPLDPFEVTYDYDASATQDLSRASSLIADDEPTEPPAGVLALYSDGVLECAINVGAGATGGECPVDYQALGTHRVTTIYTAGNESATVTEMKTIEPIPTSTGISVTYQPLQEARFLDAGCAAEICELPAGLWGNADIEIGTLTATVHEVIPWNAQPITTCFSGGPSCVSLTPGVGGGQTFSVVVLADLQVPEHQILVEGQPINATMLPPRYVTLKEGGPEYVSPAEIESGAFYFRATSGTRPGYTSSEATAPIRFTPQAAASLRYR